MSQPTRCTWCGDKPIYVRYHDEEWGVPEWDDRALFEKLLLDGFQAGISWLVILKKRDGFREAFDGFDPALIARYDDARIAALRQDPRIVRNRAKIDAAVGNAQAWLEIMSRGSFSEMLWDFVGGAPKVNRWTASSQVPAQTETSKAMSKALKKAGFKFVGPTIVYAFMQAVGMVNDHTVDCFRHAELSG